MCVVGFLAVDSNEEVALFIGVEGRRDDAVVARFEAVASANLARVDEGRRFCDGRVVLEEIDVERTAVGVFQL